MGTSSYCLVAGEMLRVPSVRNLAIGQATLFNVDDDTAVVVVRDVNGLYAMSGICTHQCCLVSLCGDDVCSKLGTNPGGCNATAVATPSVTGAAIICPCHGSAFAIDGSVLTGPAIRPLPHYGLVLDGDDALVDTSRAVGSTTRA
jgi:Rieske Fe-S protein